MGLFRRAQGVQLAGAAAGRGQFGHHPGRWVARGFQGLQRFAQPGAVADGHPGRGAGPGAWLQGKVQLRRVVEQPLFEQAFEHRAQARALQADAGGQGHTLPGQRTDGHHGHHFARGTAHGGQQRGAGTGVARGVVAVRAQRVRVFGGGAGARQGQGKDQGAHGRVSRAIVGGDYGNRGQGIPTGWAAPRSRQTVKASMPWRRTTERSCTAMSPRRRRPCTSK